MENKIKNLFVTFALDHDKKIIHYLIINGVTFYESLCKLSEKNFFLKCESYYEKRGFESLNPGQQLLIQILSEKVNKMDKQAFENVFVLTNFNKKNETSFPLLKAMIEQESERNFSSVIKKFCLLLRLKCGKQAYEILSKNLPLPQVNTLNDYISEFQHIHESEIYGSELLQHMKDFGCSDSDLNVFISEDATTIIKKVEYKPDSDDLIGFVSPMDDSTGFPLKNMFPATSVAHVKRYFDTYPKARYVYAIVATPLSKKATPFILSLFSTSNKFSYNHVSKRFSTIKEKLMEYNINVIGYASDADSRLLKSMKMVSELGKPSKDEEKWNEIFSCNLHPEFVVFQDLFHIVSKIRNRLLDTAFPMKIGTEKISLASLKCALKDYPYLKKYVRPTDLEAEDRMNVAAGLRICHEEVLKHLNDPGLRVLLSLLRNFVQAFEDPSLSFEDKVIKAWTFNFVLRGWKRDISSNSQKYVKEFIALPTYQCIELNCHNLVIFYIKLRDRGQLNVFNFLNKCNSQPCEELFRRFRSMTTMNYTNINMTMLEVCYKAKRINTMFRLEYDLEEQLCIPGSLKSKNTEVNVQLFDDDEIFSFLLKAQQAASEILSSVGVKVQANSFNYQFESHSVKTENLEDDEQQDALEETQMNIVTNVTETQCDSIGTDDGVSNDDELEVLRKYCGVYLEKCSPENVKNKIHFYVNDGDSTLRIRKDAFVRLFNEPDFVSKDRTKRFMSKKKENKLQEKTDSQTGVKSCISTSDYIIVEQFNGVARVLEFKNIHSSIKTKTAGRVKSHTVEINDDNKDNIGMLLDYFTIGVDGTLCKVYGSNFDEHSFVSLRKYKCHISEPEVIDIGQLKLKDKESIMILIEKYFQEPLSKPAKSNRKRMKQSCERNKKLIVDACTESESDPDYELEQIFLKKLKKRKRQLRK